MLSALQYIPLREQWFTENQLFLCGEPRLVRAVVHMLVAAWRGNPAGSIAPSYSVIGGITGLTEREIAEHYQALTQGWELRDERLYHIEMAALCERLYQRHEESIAMMTEDLALAAQSPETFELGVSVTESRRNAGKRALRPTWQPSQASRQTLAAKGITLDGDIKYLVEKMRNWALAKGIKRVDWDAQFLNFVDKEPLQLLPSRQGGEGLRAVPGGSRFGALAVSRGQAATEHNLAMFQRSAPRGG